MLSCQLSVQEMESRRKQVIYGKTCRIASSTGKEITHGASLDNTSHQKEEWVGKITIIVMLGLFLFLVFTSHY